MSTLNAREEFIYLLGKEYVPYIDDFLRLHAHELAEKIRDAPWSPGHAAGCCDDERGAMKAADLIDPEAPSV